MERLIYNEETQKLLEGLTEGNKCYWRYQDKEFGGVIPVGHKSFERVYSGEAPEYIEEGASCYDNPLQLMNYIMGDTFIEKSEQDVVLFVGRHMGYGLDEEDIVMVEEESDILYSMDLLDFLKFCSNADLYWNTKNIKEEYYKYF